MKKQYLLVLFFLFAFIFGFAQTQKKYYYNINWKNCSKSNAAYYRVFALDEEDNPVGEIKDYYMSGKLQSVSEGALYIDKKDDSNSKFIGRSIVYFESGLKRSEALNSDKGELLSFKSWYENGNLAIETEYTNAEQDGYLRIYHESGKLYRKIKQIKGENDYSSIVECDESGRCEYIFLDDLSTPGNKNGWPVDPTGEKISSQIIPKYGLSMNIIIKGRYIHTIDIPLNSDDNFVIEADMVLHSGEWVGSQGLIWGLKDSNNYYSFEIDPDGYFRIGAMNDGTYNSIVNWSPFRDLSYAWANNHLKVNRKLDKVFYSINGTIVAESKFYDFRGAGIGFFNEGEKREVLFSDLVVQQDIFVDRLPTTFIPSGDWLGNGSGFFIDKSGYIATNHHVIDNVSVIEVEFSRNGQKYRFPATIVKSDSKNDLAILKIRSSHFEPFDNIPYNIKTDVIDVGSSVFALGFPKALSYMGLEIKFTDGKISSNSGYKGDIKSYQISVPIQAGNSGGPLFDLEGNLVGITSSGINKKLDETENVNYAIKTSYLGDLIDDLDQELDLPNDNSLAKLQLTDQIKQLKDYVVLIKVK